MAERKNPLIVSALTVAMTVFGIFFLVRFRPTPDFRPLTLLTRHYILVAVCLTLAAAAGAWWTRDGFQTLMLGLGGFFALTGLFFVANGALDRHRPEVLMYIVVAKDKQYQDNGSQPGSWNHFLKGRTQSGRRFRFSTWGGHIRMAEWEAADPRSGNDAILVWEYPGFLGTLWWEIKGLQKG